MQNDTFQLIKELLERESIQFRTVHHQPTYTSEESAKARGEDISTGGKAMVMKVSQTFKLFVLSAALKVDSAAIKRHFQEKRIRFANREELLELTGLVPGSVPPFGEPTLPLELYVDNSILRNEKIAFNAGSLTDSVIMRTEDYILIAKPKEVFDFSVPAQET